MKVSIPALVQQLALRQRPEAAQYKWSRTKAQVLPPLIPIAPNQLDAFYLSELSLRDDSSG
jgi:hypothetical protein